MMKKLIISLCILTAAVCANAKVTLPSVLSDGMVLQRNTDVTLWGKANPGKKVTIRTSWNGLKTSVKADSDGRWECSVPTGDAGGPYTIDFSDGEKLTLSNVLLGEVWFSSGQSNMEMPVGGFYRQWVEGGNDTIMEASPDVPLRMFITDLKPDSENFISQWNPEVQEEIYGNWFLNTPEGVSKCSAVSYYFAKKLQEVLGVPVGIVVSTRGATRIESWISREVLDAVKPGLTRNPSDMFAPSFHFNGEIAPLTRFAVAGFIWYQGESNHTTPLEYAMLYETMVRDWRSRWGRGDLPFYAVQVTPYNYSNPMGTDAAILREQQFKGAEAIPNGGIVCTIDIGSGIHIHPPYKRPVGDRLAMLALARCYGRTGFLSVSPSFESMKIKDGKALISFRDAPHGIGPMLTDLEGFEIAGSDKVFHPAKARVDSYGPADLEVWSPEVPDPVAVRYCFRNCPSGSVHDPAGLPLFPFRTDDWEK